MKLWVIPGFLALTYAAAWVGKSMAVNLKHFSSTEFRGWWPFMDNNLLHKLDAWREALGPGYTVMISPVKGAIGRRYGSHSSQHFVSAAGAVKAIDVFPAFHGRALSKDQLRRAYQIAVQIGFTGIGVYPDTAPRPMMHLDVRTDRNPGDPALWTRFAATGRQDHPIARAFV